MTSSHNTSLISQDEIQGDPDKSEPVSSDPTPNVSSEHTSHAQSDSADQPTAEPAFTTVETKSEDHLHETQEKCESGGVCHIKGDAPINGCESTDQHHDTPTVTFLKLFLKFIRDRMLCLCSGSM